jgi:amino acid permease
MLTLALIATAGLFLAWFFIRRARFKEKITLIEKGIDIKDLNLMGNTKSYSPWLRIGIIITGTALGALLMSIIQFHNFQTRQAVILLFLGISVVLTYFIDPLKDKK